MNDAKYVPLVNLFTFDKHAVNMRERDALVDFCTQYGKASTEFKTDELFDVLRRDKPEIINLISRICGVSVKDLSITSIVQTPMLCACIVLQNHSTASLVVEASMRSLFTVLVNMTDVDIEKPIDCVLAWCILDRIHHHWLFLNQLDSAKPISLGTSWRAWANGRSEHPKTTNLISLMFSLMSFIITNRRPCGTV